MKLTTNNIQLTTKFLICFLVLSAYCIVMAGVAQAAAVVGTDPMRVGVSARTMGMGKAYVAVAEDADTVFVNPAGLGNVMTSPKISSMYTNLMSDANYIVLGGAYPFGERSAIGAGIVYSGVSGIDLRDSAGLSMGNGSWNNSVIFASYGMRMPDDKLKFGGSLKYYTQGGTGTSEADKAAGSGFGLDAGALYSVNENLNVGVSAQNPLGTKIDSGNGITNTLPSTIKAGAAYTTKIGTSKLILAADYDIVGKQNNAMHLGAEYYLTPMFALRAGLDQDPAPGGAVTNFTAGLGLRVQGIAFDFAYHPYDASGKSIQENATYYFSVGYVGAPEAVKELDMEMSINSPADKSIVYTDNVKVSGTLKAPSNKETMIKVNGIEASLLNDGTFTAQVPVSELGKKLIHVEAIDNKGRKLAEDRRVLRLVSFNDVGGTYWAKAPIEHTGTVGLVQGYPDGTFKPDRSLTRAELATILVRAKGYKVPGRPIKVFKDVASASWAAGYIEIAKRTGMIKGYPDKKFRPNNQVSMAEAITLMARFDGLNKMGGQTAFRDVPSKHWSAGYVNSAEKAGMLSWVKDESLQPKKAVSRAESVQMMSKTSLAVKMIDDLLSWDKGFQFEITRPTIRASL